MDSILNKASALKTLSSSLDDDVLEKQRKSLLHESLCVFEDDFDGLVEVLNRLQQLDLCSDAEAMQLKSNAISGTRKGQPQQQQQQEQEPAVAAARRHSVHGLSSHILLKDFYMPSWTRDDAINFLTGLPPGCFVLRPCSLGVEAITVSYVSGVAESLGKVKHCVCIRDDQGQYSFRLSDDRGRKMPKFETLQECLRAHRVFPRDLSIARDALQALLVDGSPVPSPLLDSRRQVMHREARASPPSPSPSSSPSPSPSASASAVAAVKQKKGSLLARLRQKATQPPPSSSRGMLLKLSGPMDVQHRGGSDLLRELGIDDPKVLASARAAAAAAMGPDHCEDGSVVDFNPHHVDLQDPADVPSSPILDRTKPVRVYARLDEDSGGGGGGGGGRHQSRRRSVQAWRLTVHSVEAAGLGHVYEPEFTRADADQFLEGKPPGTFVIRPSSKGKQFLAVSWVHMYGSTKGTTKHCLCRRTDQGKYTMQDDPNKQQFDTLLDCLAANSLHPPPDPDDMLTLEIPSHHPAAPESPYASQPLTPAALTRPSAEPVYGEAPPLDATPKMRFVQK